MIRFCCPCHFGLESVLSFEIKKLGGENLAVTDGRVSFDGELSMLPRANIFLYTAERVLIELGSFRAESFEELFQGVKSLPLEDFIGKHDRFPVKGHSIKSRLHSIPDCQSIVKKAAVTRLSSVYGISRFEETGANLQISFNILKDIATIYLDTTGEGLHKRGYRRDSNAAPIKETLAAGIIDLARVRTDSVVCDPMCGSGTFLIESAYRAMKIAPGSRRRFVSESWDSVPKSLWSSARTEAKDGELRNSSFKGIGYDIDAASVALTNKNAGYAGVSGFVHVKRADISDFKQTPGVITICNPPYGERLLDIKQAEELYKRMGRVLSPSGDSPLYVISPHEEFETLFGRKADRKRKLYNGMLKCQLYMYFR